MPGAQRRTARDATAAEADWRGVNDSAATAAARCHTGQTVPGGRGPDAVVYAAGLHAAIVQPALLLGASAAGQERAFLFAAACRPAGGTAATASSGLFAAAGEVLEPATGTVVLTTAGAVILTAGKVIFEPGAITSPGACTGTECTAAAATTGEPGLLRPQVPAVIA